MKKSELKKLIKEELTNFIPGTSSTGEINVDAKVVDGNKLAGSKTKQEINKIIVLASDNYMAMATKLRDEYPQILKDPKMAKYINGLAQNIKDLKTLKDSIS